MIFNERGVIISVFSKIFVFINIVCIPITIFLLDIMLVEKVLIVCIIILIIFLTFIYSSFKNYIISEDNRITAFAESVLKEYDDVLNEKNK